MPNTLIILKIRPTDLNLRRLNNLKELLNYNVCDMISLKYFGVTLDYISSVYKLDKLVLGKMINIIDKVKRGIKFRTKIHHSSTFRTREWKIMLVWLLIIKMDDFCYFQIMCSVKMVLDYCVLSDWLEG